MALLKRFWYLVAAGIAGLAGLLYGLFRRPSVIHAPAPISEKERESEHEKIDSQKEEKVEARNNKIDDEIRDCLDRFRSE